METPTKPKPSDFLKNAHSWMKEEHYDIRAINPGGPTISSTINDGDCFCITGAMYRCVGSMDGNINDMVIKAATTLFKKSDEELGRYLSADNIIEGRTLLLNEKHDKRSCMRLESILVYWNDSENTEWQHVEALLQEADL